MIGSPASPDSEGFANHLANRIDDETHPWCALCAGLRRNPQHTGHICTDMPPKRTDDLATLLTRRAGDDPAWWAVVRQYALGHARWPDPFQPRKPKRPLP